MQKSPVFFSPVAVTFTGQSRVSHVRAKVPTDVKDALGFGALCEDRLGLFVPSGAKRRPGRLLGSLAVMLTAGGEHISDLDSRRIHPAFSGSFPQTRRCRGSSNGPW